MNEIILSENTQNALQQHTNIQSCMERFIEFVNVQDVTADSYCVALRCFGDWMQDNGISQPERGDIVNYIKWLAVPHPRRQRIDRPDKEVTGTIKFAAGTQARYLRAVKMFFKWTAQEQPPFFYPNIADNLKGAKVSADNKKRDALERDSAMKVLNSIDRTTEAGKRDYAMILLSITAGLRVIEMQRATVGNLEVIAGERVLFIQGKGHAEADAYKKLPPAVCDAINDYLTTRGALSAEKPLFAGVGNRSRGRALTEPSMSRIIKNRLKDAGFNTHRISAHSLRHSSVTFLLEAGATLQEAQNHARHASPETTGIYAHNIDQKKQHPEQKIYDFLFGNETDAATQATECLHRMTTAQQEQALALLKAIAR